MKLDSVLISNFRSIHHVVVSFDPACRVLVGINESGKSNILRALAFLDEGRKPSRKNDVRESLPEEDSVTSAFLQFDFSFEKSDVENFVSKISERILYGDADPPIAEIDGQTWKLKKFTSLFSRACYTVNLIEETKYHQYYTPREYKLIEGWKKPSDACPDDFSITINGSAVFPKKFALIFSEGIPEIPSNYLTPASTADINQNFGKAVMASAKTAHLKSIFWEYDEKNLLPSQITLDTFAADPSSCLPLKNMFSLAGINDIAKELQHVKTLSRNGKQNFFDRIAARTTSHFRSVWKEYKNIEFQLDLDADKIVPGIKEKNSFDFSKRSDGFKRFVTFLLMVSVNVKTDNLTNTLVLIDEPDYGLHPSGARYLRDELIQISAKNYVVYSTHSIFMIDADNIARHYIVKKSSETTTIETATEHNIAEEEVLYNALGYSVFEALKPKNIIFEGWRDKRLFEVGLNKSGGEQKKKFKNVGICHANGVSHIKTITPSMELARRGCLIVSDADAAAKQQQKKYRSDRGYGEWNTYQEIDNSLEAITGEDFLKNSYLAAQVNAVIAEKGLPEFEANALPAEKYKLKAIYEWLKAQGVAGQDLDEIQNTIKTALFENLTGKSIEDAYQKLIAGLSKKLGDVPEA